MALRTYIRLSVVAVVAVMSFGSAQATQCGWHSGNYARTCSSHAAAGCLRAAKRGVAGFTVRKCQEDKARCSKCLKTTLACANRADRPGRAKDAVTQSCQKCDAGFGRCMGKE
jgi:hypothetical protein